MATKVLELELSEKIGPIPVEAKYDSYYILVRFKKQPLGWVRSGRMGKDFITATELRQIIKEQLGHHLIQQVLAHQLGIIKESNIINKPISVVVCTRDRTQHLASCLEGL